MKPRIDKKIDLEKYFKKVAKSMGFGLTYNKQTPTNKNLEAKPFPAGYPFCNYEYFGVDINTAKDSIASETLSKQELKKRFKEDII